MRVHSYHAEDRPVNSLTDMFSGRPDGSKKAYARLTPDADALDIAATKLALV